MLIEHRGFRPLVDPAAYIAPTAVLVGKVQAGPRQGAITLIPYRSGLLFLGRGVVISGR